MKSYHRLSGEITVYLALSMTVLLAFVLSVIESARTETIRFQIECAADMAMYSALAEYQRELWKQYHLFFVDMSYGSLQDGVWQTERHLKDFMEYNLNPEKDLEIAGGLFGVRDFLDINRAEAEVLSTSLATDETCGVLKSQAVSYMKECMGVGLVCDAMENMRYIEEHDMLQGIEEERERNREQIRERQNKKVWVGGEQKRIEIEDPAGHIPVRDTGMVYLVTSDSGGVSGQAMTPSAYVSGRTCNVGEGAAPERQLAAGMMDELLFGEYLLRHLGCYTERKTDCRLQYELEYIINGKSNDAENLKDILNRILLIREVSNFFYLQTDEEKQSKAGAVAAAVAAVTFMPELEEILKEGILLAWAYTESVNDVKILLEQGKVPLQKERTDWKLGFLDMLHYRTALTGGSGGRGMSYEDYLRVLLLLQNAGEKAERFADIVEMDVRRVAGNENFCLDHCTESVEVYFTAESGYGYEYSIQKRYGYEMLE